MVKTRGLGRGLDALIPVLSEAGEELRQVKVAEIRPNPRQARETWDEEGIKELAESIAEHGLLQPVVVRPLENGYELVAGERRWRACRMLGWESIPALVREYDDVGTATALLVENLQRENLNPLEEALAYRRLIEEFGLSQEEVARRVGKSRAAVANALRLLHLPPGVLRLLRTGELTAGHARALLSIGDRAAQERLAREAVEKGLSVRAVEAAVKRRAGRGAERVETAVVDEEMAAAAAELAAFFGAAVKVRPARRRWRLEVYFGSKDEIRELVGRLCGRRRVSRET
ncbi:MAG: ParB/RepB/Spo0J family partition protein [Bacillota bacterium]